jgi:hypothetical protein
MNWERDVERIAAYHRERTENAIDERTWSDLDLDDVVAKLDTTRSGVGQQILYHVVRTPRFDVERLHAREAAIGRAVEKREALTRELTKLSALDLYDLHQLFDGELPPRPPSVAIFPAISVASLLAVIATFIVPQALFALMALALVSFTIHFTYRRKIWPFIQPVTVLKRLLDCGERIARITGDVQLRDDARDLAPLRQSTRWLVLEQMQSAAGGLADILYGYLNMFLLLDVNAFVFSLETIRARRVELQRLFTSVGMWDAMLAVADFRNEHTIVPTFIDAPREAHFTRIAHPLIDGAIPNDLDLRGRSILVTGSNMSGKTTFLRTIGVNAVLAQTIHTVVAREYRAPLLHVRTSIGKSDSLMEGRSYYLREVDDIRALVEASSSSEPHLFIVDELFRGTNTRERIAAGSAVLRHLNRHLTLASTHDLELIDLLEGEYEFHHFRESIRDGDLTFDYTLHDGPSSTRNAIAILELRRFPRSVIEEALATVTAFDSAAARAPRPASPR